MDNTLTDNMNESQFHLLADTMLGAIADAVEPADGDGALESEYQGGINTITFPDGRQLIISKHTASRQIWLSSPVSGGLHFSHNGEQWVLPDGRSLESVLTSELKTLADADVDI